MMIRKVKPLTTISGMVKPRIERETLCHGVHVGKSLGMVRPRVYHTNLLLSRCPSLHFLERRGQLLVCISAYIHPQKEKNDEKSVLPQFQENRLLLIASLS